jgi:hypothetical protein
MNALSSVLIAVVCYAIGNLIMAYKLVGVSSLSSVPFYTAIIVVGVFTISKGWVGTGHTVSTWNATHVPWLIALGALLIVADIAFVGAYNLPGASVPMITTSAALLPVIVALIDKVFVNGKMPSIRTMIAFALALFVVWLVAYDPANQPKDEEIEATTVAS